LECLT